jgi:predicted RNA binding protein with dsRBD fold (UPF0201 family)
MKIEADLKPTENPKKIIEAIKNIFPDSNPKVKKNKIIGDTDGKKFEELIAKQNIKATIYKEMQKGYIDINKLAALAGIVSIDEDFPLGKIRLYLK